MINWHKCLSALAFLPAFSPLAMALGPGELFITNYNDNSVTVYSRTATGAPAPTRTIRTGLTSPFGVLVDQLHNEIFVTNNCRSALCAGFEGSVQVYDLNANFPNDTPKRTIIGANTGLVHCTGLNLDFLRQELYVANDDGESITVFARTANGNVEPLRTISGSATGLNGPVAVNLNLFRDEIFVVNKVSGSGGSGSITVYPRTTNGNVSPIRSIQGALTEFNLPIGMDFDLLRNDIVVTNAEANSILVFPTTANGDVAPSRIVQGTGTGLCIPSGIVVDLLHNEMVVANSGLGANIGFNGTPCSQSVAVYQLSASGDASPLRLLNVGVATGPVSVAETLISFP